MYKKILRSLLLVVVGNFFWIISLSETLLRRLTVVIKAEAATREAEVAEGGGLAGETIGPGGGGNTGGEWSCRKRPPGNRWAQAPRGGLGEEWVGGVKRGVK